MFASMIKTWHIKVCLCNYSLPIKKSEMFFNLVSVLGLRIWEANMHAYMKSPLPEAEHNWLLCYFQVSNGPGWTPY